jgi:hypothetical protein
MPEASSQEPVLLLLMMLIIAMATTQNGTGYYNILNGRSLLQKQSKQMTRNYVRTSKNLSFHIFATVSDQIVVFEYVKVNSTFRRCMPVPSVG